MNSVILPQLIKFLISDLLCCFWEDVLWLLRRRWLMCLFVCCRLENCLSCISFCFSRGLSWSCFCSACQSWRKGRQAAGEKGLSPLWYHGYNPYLTLHVFFMLHTPAAASLSSGGRHKGSSLAGLKPDFLICVFWLNSSPPFLIGVLPTRHWEGNPPWGSHHTYDGTNPAFLTDLHNCY